MKYRFKHVVEYAALRTVAGVVCVLPYRAALSLGWVLAWIAFYGIRFRVQEAQRRIREVFGDRFSRREVRRIAWISLRNTVFCAVEMMRAPRMTPAWCAKMFDREPAEKMKEMLAGKGAILALPHMGTWEVAGIAAQAFGLPVFFITGQQKNPLTNAWMNRMRGFTGIETIQRDAFVLKKVIRNLRNGKILAMLTDLRSRTPALSVNFLGKQANLVAGTGMFARQAGVPVYPVILRREGWTGHSWVIKDPIFPDPERDRDEDWLRIVQHVVNLFEEAVRESPEQFFWYNKRWVLDPLSKPSA